MYMCIHVCESLCMYVRRVCVRRVCVCVYVALYIGVIYIQIYAYPYAHAYISLHTINVHKRTAVPYRHQRSTVPMDRCLVVHRTVYLPVCLYKYTVYVCVCV